MEKTTGNDQTPTELIKEGGKGLKKVIYELISKIWEEEIIPHEWKCDILYAVHEKGEGMMCDNCRTVTLLCKMYKILENILYLKLVPFAEEIIGEYEGGF
jgi:ketopantoate reductase